MLSFCLTLIEQEKMQEDKLVKEWLTRYSESQTEVILLGDAVEMRMISLLKTFSRKFHYGSLWKDAYKKQLGFQTRLHHKVQVYFGNELSVLWKGTG